MDSAIAKSITFFSRCICHVAPHYSFLQFEQQIKFIYIIILLSLQSPRTCLHHHQTLLLNAVCHLDCQKLSSDFD